MIEAQITRSAPPSQRYPMRDIGGTCVVARSGTIEGRSRPRGETVTAVIRWKSAQQGGRRTPPAPHYRTVARFAADPRWPDETWSLIVEPRWFSLGGEITVADVRFLVETAPQSLLTSGAKFELLEGDRIVATGVVMPAERTLDQIEQLAEAI